MKTASARSLRRYLRVLALVLVAVAVVSAWAVYRAAHYPMVDMRINDEERASRGYTLVTFIVDDIGRELTKPSTIYLLDMDGEVIHRWHVMGSVQLAKIKPDGNLLCATRDRSFKERAGLREVDPYGNIVWYYSCWADHDFAFLPGGNILIHYIEDKEVPAVGPGQVRCPGIVEVNPQKEVVWQWRGEEHLGELTRLVGIEFPLAEELRRYTGDVLDWAHSNTCQVIGENETVAKDARFKTGDIVFSYCNLNTIGVIDRRSGEISWAWGPGTLDGQHSPMMMRNGNLLIFDNGTERGYSRVIEFDPRTEAIVWEYNDRDARKPEFYSRYTSGAHPLGNGNVFICQASARPPDIVSRFFNQVRRRLLGQTTAWSRLFEVTRSNEVVWDAILNQSGDDSLHEIYQATRYSESYLRPLLEEIEEAKIANEAALKSLPYLR